MIRTCSLIPQGHFAKRIVLAMFTFALLGTAGCEREHRRFQEPAPANDPSAQSLALTELQAGTPTPHNRSVGPYEENAFAVSEGKRLFNWYNCSGCHARGGRAIGPPLMDDEWIYGSEPANIFATIVQGRPNGMPSFRGRIPEYQVWQLAAFVRSMSGLLQKDVASSRDDHIQAKEPEQSQDEQPPLDSSIPSASTQSK